jgi:hypothetical protein
MDVPARTAGGSLHDKLQPLRQRALCHRPTQRRDISADKLFDKCRDRPCACHGSLCQDASQVRLCFCDACFAFPAQRLQAAAERRDRWRTLLNRLQHTRTLG